MPEVNPILKVLQSSIENVHHLSSNVLKKAGKSKVIPPAYKKLLAEISTASIATLGHLHELKKKLT